MDDVKRPIVTREQAIEAGELRYYTGRPCIRGHLSERYTAGGSCVLCQNELGAAHRADVRRRLDAAQERKRQAALQALESAGIPAPTAGSPE